MEASTRLVSPSGNPIGQSDLVTTPVRIFEPGEAGTTEITAVCNQIICELIEPEQEKAEIILSGDSTIHLVSDFFSEHTSLTMAYGDSNFDITDLCRIEQDICCSENHIGVYFNTYELPIVTNDIARYTIRLNPMPPVPERFKFEDSLWIHTCGQPLD